MNQLNTSPQPLHPAPEIRAREFLAQASHFRLGHLPTESRNSKTAKLSQLAKTDLLAAIALLKEVELDALRAVQAHVGTIDQIAFDIQQTFASGGRVFLCGCGATGRLSLALETLWREETHRLGLSKMEDKVVSFMAGGDYALVRSIENFEDHPEYGTRQLHDLGFNENDLMIGCSEGGETPFVIGAVEEAAKISKRQAYFLYCNPTETLAKTVERSRHIIENKKVKSVSIETGPMALAGSTRLQATTALMLATGAALFANLERPLQPRIFISEFATALHTVDFTGLVPLIVKEAEIYGAGNLCVHRTSKYGITVLTDTTERSPTFSLRPFESVLQPNEPLAWTYLCHADARSANDSWARILGRQPRALEWDGFKDRFGPASLEGFDFSPASLSRRQRQSGARKVYVFDITSGAKETFLRLGDLEVRYNRPTSLLCEHLLLKCALNISSTLLMGRLDRFSGNLMLYVRAANNKLVDRAIRYVQTLLADERIEGVSYDEICLELFRTVDKIAPDEPAVWRTFENLAKRFKRQSVGAGG